MTTSENAPAGDFAGARQTADLLQARRGSVAGEEARSSPQAWWVLYCLSAISVLVMLNINGVIQGLYGIPRAASIPLGVLSVAVILLSGSASRYYGNKLTGAFVLFMAAYIGMGVFCAVPERGLDALYRLGEVGTWLLLGLSAFCGSVYLGERGMLTRFVKVLTLIVLASALCVPIFLYNNIYLFSALDETGLLQKRASGVFANPNEGGLVAALGLCLSLAGFAGRFGIVFNGVFLLVAFLVFSRGAILNCVGVIVVAGFLKFRSARAKLSTVLAFLLFVFVQFFFANELIGTGLLSADQEWRLLSLSRLWSGESSIDEIDSGRIGLIGESIGLIAKSPVVGYGLGGMLEALQGMGSHNQFLATALEAGVPAAILLVWFIGVWGWTGFRLKDEAGRVAVSCLAVWFMISCFFSHNLLDVKFSPLVIGLALGISSIELRTKRRII